MKKKTLELAKSRIFLAHCK